MFEIIVVIVLIVSLMGIIWSNNQQIKATNKLIEKLNIMFRELGIKEDAN